MLSSLQISQMKYTNFNINNKPKKTLYTLCKAVASSPRVKFGVAAVVKGIPLRNWYKATFFCIYSMNWTLQINKNPTIQKTNQNPKPKNLKSNKEGGKKKDLSLASPLAEWRVRENLKGSFSAAGRSRDDGRAFRVGCSAMWIGARRRRRSATATIGGDDSERAWDLRVRVREV